MATVSGPLTTLALPADPALAAWATVMNDAGYCAYVLDATWRYVFATDEARLTHGDSGESTAVPIGCHYFSADVTRFRVETYGGPYAVSDFRRAAFLDLGRYVLATTQGGRDELRRSVDPEFADLVDELQPCNLPPVMTARYAMKYAGTEATGSTVVLRVNNDRGHFGGVCTLVKPAAGLSRLFAASAVADLGHLERMRVVEHPDRRPTAILMADLEASSPLARRMSAAQFFAFGRRLVRAADQCIIENGGIVGRHVGDGVVSYFLAETAGSESAAARSCIAAARGLRSVLVDVAARSDLPQSDVSMRFGLHWGATLYMGRILTGGRSEVTALGDEMNEAARIEACATGGLALASKALLERLNGADAAALGIDTRRAAYERLADLSTATEKARRDAPSIAVCEV